MLPLYLCHLSLQTTGGKNEVRKGLKLSLVYLDLLDLGYAVQSLKWKNKAEKMNTYKVKFSHVKVLTVFNVIVMLCAELP